MARRDGEVLGASTGEEHKWGGAKTVSVQESMKGKKQTKEVRNQLTVIPEDIDTPYEVPS